MKPSFKMDLSRDITFINLPQTPLHVTEHTKDTTPRQNIQERVVLMFRC
jgi:hypothetical protein